MFFWLTILAMLVAAIMCVLWPLARARGGAENRSEGEPRHETEDEDQTLDVYRKQLEELERREVSTPEEQESVAREKAEVARRLLRENQRMKAAEDKPKAPKTGRAVAVLSALILIPVLSAILYGTAGSPGTPDVPLSSVQTDNLENKSIEQMVQIAERHLAKNPEDVKGWQMLSNVYGRLNRPSDRARALGHIIRISGPSPKLSADLGEALTVANGNIVPQQARELFEQAWKQDQTVLKASVYLALALEQEGRYSEALQRWEQLALKNRDDTNWQAMVTERVETINRKSAANAGTAPSGPSQQDMDNASKMEADDRLAMINSMVAGLAEKLQDEPDNIEGWLRLIRSYSVLKRKEEAVTALTTARRHFSSKPEQLARLDSLAQQVGISAATDTGATN